MQRIDAIKDIAWGLNDVIIDATPVSLTGSTLQFDELIQPNEGQLRGIYAYTYGTFIGAGQERIVGTFNPVRNEVVFPQVFTTTPTTSTDVLLTRHWRKSQYDQALDRMVGKAKTRFLEDLVATTALVATQYEYTVPSGMEWISTLRLIPSSNTDYREVDDIRRIFEIPPRFWRIEAKQTGSYVIAIDSRKIDLNDFNNQIIDIKGQAKPDIAGTDNGIIPDDLEEFIISGAQMLLSSQRVDEDKEWSAKFRMFRDEHRPLEEIVYRYGRGKKVR